MNTAQHILSHRDLDAWQHAMDLIDVIYDLATTLPKIEMFGLASQLRRSAVSVAANIAEGHGRDHLGEYLHSLSVASGEVAELDTLIEVCIRRRYVETEPASAALAVVARQGRILSGLTAALKRRYHR